MILRLIILLLIALPAWGGTERLEPDAAISTTQSDRAGDGCDTTTKAYERISATADTADLLVCDGGNGEGDNDAESYAILLSFPSPTDNVTTTTDAQSFSCDITKSSSSGNHPSGFLELWCSGVEKIAGPTQTINTATKTTYTSTFTYTPDGDCDAAGDNVEINVQMTRTGGSPTNRRSGDIWECWWNVDFTPPGAGRSRRFLWFDHMKNQLLAMIVAIRAAL